MDHVEHFGIVLVPVGHAHGFRFIRYPVHDDITPVELGRTVNRAENPDQ